MPNIHFRIIAANGKPDLSQHLIHGLFGLPPAADADLAVLYTLLLPKEIHKVLVYLPRKVSFVPHRKDYDPIAGMVLPEFFEPLLGLLEGPVARQVVQ